MAVLKRPVYKHGVASTPWRGVIPDADYVHPPHEKAMRKVERKASRRKRIRRCPASRP